MRKGDIQFGVIDAPYAATMRGSRYRTLAAAVRNGTATAPWQLVASGGVANLTDLENRRVAVPRVGAKAPVFVTNVLLEGEVDSKYFGKISIAPSSNAAANMVSLGRVDAAFVPTGTSLPGGVSRVITLRSVGLPMFVALKDADPRTTDAMSRAIFSYSGSGAITGFASAKDGRYRELRARFGKSRRDGIMSVPKPARLAVRGILADRKFRIEPSDLRTLVSGPEIARPSSRKRSSRGSR